MYRSSGCFGTIAGPGLGPAWSQVAAQSWPGGLPRAVGEPKPLYPEGGRWHVHHGAWSPDSSTLLFTHDTDYADVFVLEEDR